MVVSRVGMLDLLCVRGWTALPWVRSLPVADVDATANELVELSRVDVCVKGSAMSGRLRRPLL